jgi:hypothetical protein
MREHLHVLLREMENHDWLDIAGYYQTLAIEDRGHDWLQLGDARLDSAAVALHFQHAEYLAFGVCTLGAGPSVQIRDRFAGKKRLQAVLLDEISTLLLYQVCDFLELRICAEAGRMGLQAGGTLNPGDNGFDISLQGTVLQLAGGNSIGVTLQGSGTLSPHKSMTMVLGLGRQMQARSTLQRCRECRSRRHCPHRLHVPAGVAA